MGSMSPYANWHRHKTPNVQGNAKGIGNNIGMRHLSRIEKILGVNLTGNHTDIQDQSAKKIASDHDEMVRLLEAFSRITDPSVRANILALVEAVADNEG